MAHNIFRHFGALYLVILITGCAQPSGPPSTSEDFSTKTLDRAASIELNRNCLGDPTVGRRISTTQTTQKAE